jgi:hypothetical protein
MAGKKSRKLFCLKDDAINKEFWSRKKGATTFSKTAAF